ncbi:MAG: hydroxylamine oxidase [Nitrospirae bacterium]|nr:hydroxylamine oxidase [Nitrospirota bacterium]
MKKLFLIVLGILLFHSLSYSEDMPLSKETQSCLNCHKALTPGIVQDWLSSRHSKTTPSSSLNKPSLERRVSAESIDEKLKNTVVGCYECHSRNPEKHKDNFLHFGWRINVVVSSSDCSTCHPLEFKQYMGGKKAHAIGNLKNNPVYHTLVNTIIGLKAVNDIQITSQEPSDYTRQETCFACHGTELKVNGMKDIDTKLGKITVPDISHWPNQGVGRINPDGSMGACTPCHPRHSFSIEVARKPFTCAQCHLEPDVPAWNVYAESKHGNIFLSEGHKWDFSHVPWIMGVDFATPTCAVCHNSLITGTDGGVIVERSHDFGSRLWVRLFGLIYSHPQPKQGDTSIIKNSDGLPLPTTFLGNPASDFLIDDKEQQKRQSIMKAVCLGCHSTDWTNNHFEKLKNTLKETDLMTLSATKLLLRAWEHGVSDNSNPFDEEIEQLWIKQWLFYGNSIRYASAMTGAPDYTAFKYGWWGLTTNLQEMKDLIEIKEAIKKAK